VEAGAKLSGAFLALGLVDELLLYFAPSLLGDTARGMFALPVLESLEARIRLDIREITRLGDDWRVLARVQTVIQLGKQEKARRLRGKIRWEGDLDEMRTDK